MRPEIEYQMWVKQPMDRVMAQVEEDAKAFGIGAEEVDRAVFEWIVQRLQQAETLPEWFLGGMPE